jgi:hypothetical protein
MAERGELGDIEKQGPWEREDEDVEAGEGEEEGEDTGDG